MLHTDRFNRCCEIVGRVSAMITLVGVGTFVLAATALDVLR
jgi:hypothetical protein